MPATSSAVRYSAAYRTIETPVGTLLLAATAKGLVRVAYASEDHDLVLERLARGVSPRILRAPARLDGVAREIEEYFARRRSTFDVPLDLQLSHGFRRTVLSHLPEIGYGKTASYDRRRKGGWPPEGGSRRGQRMREQPAARGSALSPRRAERRDHRTVRRWRRGEAPAARAGVGGMTVKTYTLLGPDRRPYQSATPATLAGHRPGRLYGNLDCPAALGAIARGGGYIKNRVFFADERDATKRLLQPLV